MRTPRRPIARAPGLDPRSGWAFAALVAAAVLAVLPADLGWAVRGVAAWDAALLVLLGLPWRLVLRSDAEMTRKRAARQDPGAAGVLVIVLLASTASLVAAVVLLNRPERFVPRDRVGLLVVLGVASVVGAWALMHTAFALHYAHLYYREDDDPGGLNFPGGDPPDDLDFAYFAFMIGMTFQTGDVAIADRGIRHLALGQAILSFAYNTAILALAVSLLFGRLK